MDKHTIVERTKQFLVLQGVEPSPNRAALLTVMRDHQSQYFSLVVDLGRGILVNNYPVEGMSNDYSEATVRRGADKFVACFTAGLPVDPIATFPEYTGEHAGAQNTPFCGHKLVPYRPRRLDKEQLFSDFLAESGTHSGVIYQVTRNIDNGPELSQTLWTLVDGRVEPYSGETPTNKLHAFKNYKCPQCSLFFSVDLLSTTAQFNYHHMRLVPRTSCHDLALINAFFTAALPQN
eukprot:m51a1_g6508 hypothetical protein (234) ;mRNA; f:240217-240918